MTIGFIGQGWIGKNYADNFEERGYQTVRYALEEPYRMNKEKIKECDIVFVAVPTPTTPKGFDPGIVQEALSLIGKGKIAVIKSTVLPGSTAYDAAHPFSNIVGLSVDDEVHRAAAQKVLTVLPEAPFVQICTSTEAELIKYSHNLNGYFQVILANVLYDTAQTLSADWEKVREALDHDPYVANRYGKPVHKTGRGAGGGCFIKDFAAFRELYKKLLPKDTKGLAVLAALEQKNIELLKTSGKDTDLLSGVYGE